MKILARDENVSKKCRREKERRLVDVFIFSEFFLFDFKTHLQMDKWPDMKSKILNIISY